MNGTVEASWAGGASPWGVSWQKLMMWLFIVTDALLFAGFLASYGFTRHGSADWPAAGEAFSLPYITLMTFTLISTSATMACAVTAARAGDQTRVSKFLLLTLLGGIAFLAMQGIEWGMFIGHGGALDANPWGDRSFGAYFFMITGFHGTHVLIGVIVLAISLFKSLSNRHTPDGIEVAGLYWHFVDLVWVFIFGCFYLL